MTFLFLQFLPILVFVVVDSLIENTVVSIFSAVGFTAVQAGVTWYLSGKFDYFLLIDLGLIAVMGGISIATNDDRYFLVKPAVIEGLCIPFLLFFVFAPDRYIMQYFGRYMPTGKVLNPVALPLLKRMLAIMSGYIALHVLAILYTARHSTRKIWAMVSGPGFYFIFIPVMVFVLAKRYRQRRTGGK
jgi:intracellular septation protein A